MPDANKGLVISVGKGDKRQVIQQPGLTIKVQGRAVSTSAGRGIDIVFVIDTTGSMSDKIEGLLATCSRFVDELAKLALSHRIAVVAFGDLTVPGDDITVFEFTDDVQRVKETLSAVPRYGGGGNSGESSLEALDKALALHFRPNVVKALILITDEPALQHEVNAVDLTRRLAQKEMLTFVVSPPEHYYQEMARRTGGVWYQVSANADFTGLIEVFRKLAAKLSSVVADVYRLGNGSVAKYLQIKAPSK
jgi:Mg-chelatase subunit ChlD